MHKRFAATLILLSGSFWLAGPALSQPAPAALDIPLIDRTPELEDFRGMEPSAGIRNQMSTVTGFTQRVPDDGAPASQRTEVYVAYDERNLYAVFLAFDAQPERVRANLSPRENIENDDTVGMLIDTFNDQRTGYAFRATPLGVQWDGRWAETSGLDSSYEAVWYAEGRRTDSGYMVKMTIPLRTLRFPETREQAWRIMFERHIPRASEEAYWPAYSSTVQGRLNQAARLTGIRDVSPGRNILLIPFAFMRDFDVLVPGTPGGPAFLADTENELGLDAKFVFRDSLVLDATLNPDFSQVESDEPQITVNERFEVRFPERRPFFLENADFFETETTLVFTRRIVDPQAGLKFTGRQGPWGIGAMLIDDEAPGQNRLPADPLAGKAADIGVLRVYRDLSEQSHVGFLWTDREFGDEVNRVLSVDSRLTFGENWNTDLQYVETETLDASGAKLSGSQTNLSAGRSGRHLRVHAHVLDTSEGYRADLGFLHRDDRPDTRGAHATIRYNFWPESATLNSWGPSVTVDHIEDQTGLRLYSQFMPELTWTWDGDTALNVYYEEVRERLRPQDFPGLSRNKDFARESWSLSFESQAFPEVGIGAEITSGTAINFVPPAGMEPELADSATAEISLLWRPIDRLRIDTTYLYTELEDRGGAGKIFSNEILRSRWNYQFTKELSLRFIAQHEDTNPGVLTALERDKNLNFDVLVRYVINPWSALYVGYNSNSSNFELVDTETGTDLIRTNDFSRDGEQIFVKFSYLVQP